MAKMNKFSWTMGEREINSNIKWTNRVMTYKHIMQKLGPFEKGKNELLTAFHFSIIGRMFSCRWRTVIARRRASRWRFPGNFHRSIPAATSFINDGRIESDFGTDRRSSCSSRILFIKYRKINNCSIVITFLDSLTWVLLLVSLDGMTGKDGDAVIVLLSGRLTGWWWWTVLDGEGRRGVSRPVPSLVPSPKLSMTKEIL